MKRRGRSELAGKAPARMVPTLILAVAAIAAVAAAPPRLPSGETRQIVERRCPAGQAWSAVEKRCVPLQPRG